MNTPSPSNQTAAQAWQPIFELTQQMAMYAQEGEWVMLAELETKRRVLLEEFFSRTISPQDRPHLKRAIEQLLALDAQVLQTSKTERDTLAAELQKLSQGRKIHQAYSSNSR